MKSDRARLHGWKGASGYTLVELVITVALGALILVIAMPGFAAITHKNRINSAATQLYLTLNTARSEALKRRSAVRVCPSADSSSCRTDGDWSAGWLIFEDGNGNNVPDGSEIISLVNSKSLHAGIEMQVTSSMASYLQFQPTGGAIGSGGNTGELKICHSNSTVYSKTVSVSATGRVDAVSQDPTNCVESG